MKHVLFVLTFLFSGLLWSQNDQLAQYYYDRGEFDKAITVYKELNAKNPGNSSYVIRLAECFQQLEQYAQAHDLLKQQYERYKQGLFLVELGYNEQLQNKTAQAQNYYQQAVARIEANANEVYSIAQPLEKKGQLDLALQAYDLAMRKNENFNFGFQRGIIYGQKGDIDQMITIFLDESLRNPNSSQSVRSYFLRFLQDDVDGNFSTQLRRALLLRVQKDKNIYWNDYLSWFFVQKQEYDKAFVQEKAIFRQTGENLNQILYLGTLALDADQKVAAEEILRFVIESTDHRDTLIQAHAALLRLETEKNNPELIPQFTAVLEEFGTNTSTFDIQIQYANYLAFHKKDITAAFELLDKTDATPLNPHQKARVKMDRADILLYQEKFNQALLLFTQIEDLMKNDIIGHEATLKAAKTSYYKGDFDWATQQFKALKSASSQLIANDAMEYFLLLSDAVNIDSTYAGLRDIAKGDYLQFKREFASAKTYYQEALLKNPKTEIEAVALLRLGELELELQNPTAALSYLQRILSDHPESIYRDEAYFISGHLYQNYLQQSDQALVMFEAIIMNHADSIHFVEARKRYRNLRGDVNPS